MSCLSKIKNGSAETKNEGGGWEVGRRERIGRLMWFREEIGMPGNLYQGARIMPSENGSPATTSEGQITFTLRQPQTYLNTLPLSVLSMNLIQLYRQYAN